MECKFVLFPPVCLFSLELIDTLWNVNVLLYLFSLRLLHRINRYIMECKYRLMKKFYRLSMRINRYIMECKFNKCIGTTWENYYKEQGINRYIMECKFNKCFSLLNKKTWN